MIPRRRQRAGNSLDRLQSMTALTRTLFRRSDLELILSSPANAHQSFRRARLSIAVDSVASVGLLLATLVYVAALREAWSRY
jgi:hypothetical protein